MGVCFVTERLVKLHPTVNARWEHLFKNADFSRFVSEAMVAACRERERELTEERWRVTRARAGEAS